MIRHGVMWAALATALVAATAHGGLQVQFDYTYDTGGFFSTSPTGPMAKQTLEQAAKAFSRMMDNLSPIAPAGGNQWTAELFSPATLQTVTVPGFSVPADTVIVFVGAADLGTNILGEGGIGLSFPTGDPTWQNTVDFRGQAGAALANPTDVGPWGGAISFSSTMAWNFEIPTGPGPSQIDFFSVAMHELCHVLGFGTSDAWFTDVRHGRFRGANAAALYGANVPLSNDLGHWASGTASALIDGTPQETAMDPAIAFGQRKRLTMLDFAGLQDIGWQVAKPGDSNGDGMVNGDDFVSLAVNYTGSGAVGAAWTQGDFNGDGDVDGDDFVLLAVNYTGTVVAVPEPASAGLMGLGILAAIRRRGNA